MGVAAVPVQTGAGVEVGVLLELESVVHVVELASDVVVDAASLVVELASLVTASDVELASLAVVDTASLVLELASLVVGLASGVAELVSLLVVEAGTSKVVEEISLDEEDSTVLVDETAPQWSTFLAPRIALFGTSSVTVSFK